MALWDVNTNDGNGLISRWIQPPPALRAQPDSWDSTAKSELLRSRSRAAARRLAEAAEMDRNGALMVLKPPELLSSPAEMMILSYLIDWIGDWSQKNAEMVIEAVV